MIKVIFEYKGKGFKKEFNYDVEISGTEVAGLKPCNAVVCGDTTGASKVRLKTFLKTVDELLGDGYVSEVEENIQSFLKEKKIGITTKSRKAKKPIQK